MNVLKDEKELISDVSFYDDHRGHFYRKNDRLYFSHTGQGAFLPPGLHYDMSSMVLNYDYGKDSYRPLSGNVKVIGWSSNIIISENALKLEAAVKALESILGKQSATILIDAFMKDIKNND